MMSDDKDAWESNANFEVLRDAWKSNDAALKVDIHFESLTKEVQQVHHQFQKLIWWRDVREVGVACSLIPIWLVMGIALSLPWTWYLTIPALLWVAGFMTVDRRRHPQTPEEPGAPLIFYVVQSLEQVEHQIWLLRNVFWWYLLPFGLSITAFFAHVFWSTSTYWLEFFIGTGIGCGILLAVYWSVYRLNQRAIDKTLEPRRQDLLAIVNHMQDADAGPNPQILQTLVAELSDATQSHGLRADVGAPVSLNRLIPSWREAGFIMAFTVAGAALGYLSAIVWQLKALGPALFQVVVGAVLPFEFALVWIYWKQRKRERPAISVPTADGHSALMPQLPALVIMALTLFLSVMAILAIMSFVNNPR